MTEIFNNKNNMNIFAEDDNTIYENNIVKYAKFNTDKFDFTIHIGIIKKVIEENRCIINNVNTNMNDLVEFKHILIKLTNTANKYYYNRANSILFFYDLIIIEIITIIITFIYIYNFPFVLDIPNLFSTKLSINFTNLNNEL